MEAILATLQQDAPVTEVRIGPFFTYVRSRRGGLSSSMFAHEHSEGPPVPEAGNLTEKTALELASEYGSSSDLKRCLALAAVNSLIDVDRSRCTEVNAARVLRKEGKGRVVSVVGHFPFVDRIRQGAKQLWVIEKRPREGDVPAHRASELIPESDVVAITGTALLNDTMDDLLSYCKTDSFVMIIGPTTPMSPVWFDYGVNMVCGSMVKEDEPLMRYVVEGATFRQLKNHVHLLTMAK
jgi:hypothetical protein